jgi:hypothetical protein
MTKEMKNRARARLMLISPDSVRTIENRLPLERVSPRFPGA